MSAVVRVKRHIDEEPPNAFILNCKRRKVDENAANLFANRDEVSTVLKFAGTVESQDENLATQFKKLNQVEAKELVTKVRKPQNVRDRNREEMRQSTQDNRFKVVNCYRTTNDDELSSIPKDITIVDIEKQTNENENVCQPSSSTDEIHNNSITDQTDNFVYDFYLPESNEHNVIVDNLVENLLSVRPFDDLVYMDPGPDSDDNHDSEDSNEENYFMNDYPDTEGSSIDENDMRNALNGSDNELSSDDEGYNPLRSRFAFSYNREDCDSDDYDGWKHSNISSPYETEDSDN